MERTASSELVIRQRLRVLEKNLPAAVEGNRDALHHARVATRRIREALPLLTPGDRVRRLERQIRKITQALGPVRELDVALQILEDIEDGETSPAAVARLRRAVEHERETLHADMRRRIADTNLDKLRRRAMNAARRCATPAMRRDPVRIGRARQRAARRAERLDAAIESAAAIYLPDRLHDVRIAVKKLRYALELVRELSGSHATARVRRLKKAQDLLGRMHDLEVLIARARAVQGAPGTSLKLSGELDRLVRRFETECRRLHGRYMASRRSLLEVCEHTVHAATRKTNAAA